MKHLQRAAFVVVAAAATFGLVSAATATTVTDPTGSVSVGVPVGPGGSNASGSVLAYSIDGCARSGLVAVSLDPTRYPFDFITYGDRQVLHQALGHSQTACPSPHNAEAPIAIATRGSSRGAVSLALDDGGTAYGSCWNPSSIGCLPVLAYGDYDAHGGTVSKGQYSCSASDWMGLVPGIAICSGSSHTDEEANGSIALMTGDGDANGRLLAYSNGNPSWFQDTDARSDNIAISEWGEAHGGKLAISLHNSAYSGAGGVAIAGTTWSGGGWPNPANAYTGPGGVSVAGGNANGGAVAVAGGDATTSPGGILAVSATGDAGGAQYNIDTK